MAEAFNTAALRHWRDGVLLEQEARISNSDQLYGFAAECAIKSALSHAPGRKHIDLLWDSIPVQSVQRRFPGLAAVLRLDNPFRDWTTDDRYAEDDAVSLTALAAHRDATRRLLGAVGLLGTRAGAA